MDAATSLVTTQVGSTLLTVGGIQWLKKWKWFGEASTTLHRIVSLVAAALIALGIHITFTGSASAGWSGTFQIPSLYVMLVGLFHWGAQFISQETVYTILQGFQSIGTLAKAIATMPTPTTPAIPATAAVAVTPAVKP